ncbi:hypothetical protein [Nostoc sp. PA-18-2419]|nr:hypothetical protein [Nostoc sp. PA-18-2419]
MPLQHKKQLLKFFVSASMLYATAALLIFLAPARSAIAKVVGGGRL